MNFKFDQKTEHLTNFFKDSYLTKRFSDVTIISDDLKNVRAHKDLLCYFSDFFKSIFQTTDNFTNDTVIFLKSIKHQEIETILSFIYLGEFNIEDNKIPELLSTARSLEIPQLCSVLERIQEENNGNNEKQGENLNPAPSASMQDIWDKEQKPSTQIMTKDEIIPTTGFEESEKPKTVLIQDVYNCANCFKVFSNRKSLQRHMKNEHKELMFMNLKAESVEPVIEPPKIALDSSERSKRWRDRNPKLKIDCPVCGKTVTNRTLGHHVKLVHSTKDKKCTECNKCFGTEKSLELHMKHHGDKEFVCDKCDYRSAFNGGLRLHIESKHEGIRHPCSFENCDAVYTCKGTLDNHIKTDHNGLRYECDKCEFKTKATSNMRSHKKSIHEDEYNYNCEECDMKFKARGTLRQHIKGIHQKIRYQCPVCEKLLTQFGDLKRHSKKIHKIEIPPNEGKKYIFK